MSEYVSLGDVVRFGVTIHNPSASGALINADATPRFYAYRNNLDSPTLQGLMVARAGLVGTYFGSGIFNSSAGFSTGDYVEIHVSGQLAGAVSRAIVKSFVIDDIYDVNLVRINNSGITAPNIVDANIVRVSGQDVSYNDIVNPNIYFANIKYIKDDLNVADEYTVQWFKNATPLESGQVTNPAISAFRTNNNLSLFTNQPLSHFNINHGGLRYNETVVSNLANSGEPILVKTSGLIDGSTRVWHNIVGIDYLN